MLVFNQKFVCGSRKIESTREGLAFDRPCWAIMTDLLRTLVRATEKRNFTFGDIGSRMSKIPCWFMCRKDCSWWIKHFKSYRSYSCRTMLQSYESRLAQYKGSCYRGKVRSHLATTMCFCHFLLSSYDGTCWTWIHGQSYVTPIVYLHWKLPWFVTVHRIM